MPDTVARLARAWSLTVRVPFEPGGQTAWVAPVRDRAGAERVLKVGWRHPEAEHEADGLRAYIFIALAWVLRTFLVTGTSAR